jgi:hypothetical protein
MHQLITVVYAEGGQERHVLWERDVRQESTIRQGEGGQGWQVRRKIEMCQLMAAAYAQ